MEEERDVRRVDGWKVEFIKVILTLFDQVSRIGDNTIETRSSENDLKFGQGHVLLLTGLSTLLSALSLSS